MALGRYGRIDSRRSSSSYCSTVTVVVFVALCLVGVWMMTSYSVGPAPNADGMSLENKDGIKKQQNPLLDKGNGQSFEDRTGYIPSDDKKDDNDVNSPQEDDTSSNRGDREEKIQERKEQNDREEESSSSDESKLEGRESNNHESKPDNGDSEDKSDGKEKESESEEDDERDKNSESGKNEKVSSEDDAETKTDKGDEETKPVSEDTETKTDKGDEETKPVSEDTETKTDKDDEETKPINEDTETKTDKGDEETKPVNEDTETKTDKDSGESDAQNIDSQIEGKEEQENKDSEPSVSPSGSQMELWNESMAPNESFPTQATESEDEIEENEYKWTVCNTTAGADYIPCLDNLQAVMNLTSTNHYEHRERHCPDNPPTCLVPLPEGYKQPVEWPKSREKIWYSNVPHTKLADLKGHQNWVKLSGEYLTFPGGGTQFKHGALHYIDFIQESVPEVAWGRRSRVVLDVGCGVASFGGFLFDRDVITMSLAPKDEHEAQVQFALERGIPAISAVMGTQRLPFPSLVFDLVHCARCRVPWHIEDGKLLVELNRVLRPGGFFVWSATPVYQTTPNDVEIWQAMDELTKKMCWELVSINNDTINGVGVATFKKPSSNECYTDRLQQEPSLCDQSDDPNAAWKVPLETCMHKVPEDKEERGAQWPQQWPARLETPPYWLSISKTGVYGRTAPEDFTSDYQHWTRVVTKSYLKGLGINWTLVRNAMDMRAVYGGFAAALKEMNVWVMNVVPIDSPDTLAIIYERGLFGIYHDWCESFSTYPRSYDLLHADHIFSKIKHRCNLTAVVAEVDRILRPDGKLIVRDDVETIQQLETMAKSMKWDVQMTYSKEKEGLLCLQKSTWRPAKVEPLIYAIA